MYYVGFDIHKAFTYGVVKCEKGVVLQEGKFENSDEEFASFLSKFPCGETKVVMESTGVWEFIYEILEKMGYAVKLANPVRTKAIASARVKTDAVDAATLADLLRADLIAESYIPSKEIRRLREFMRQRRALVRERTRMINKMKAIFNRQGLKLPGKKFCNLSTQWILENTFRNQDIVISYLDIFTEIQKHLKFIEEDIKDLAKKDEQAMLLQTMPGIGAITAMEIIAEAADFNRFADASRFSSYSGLVPSVKQSSTSLRYGRLMKQSSKTLKHAFIQAAWAATRTKEANSLQLFYKKLATKKGKQKAICATARKMAIITFVMLKKKEEFKA